MRLEVTIAPKPPASPETIRYSLASRHVGKIVCPYCEAGSFGLDAFIKEAVKHRREKHEKSQPCRGLEKLTRSNSLSKNNSFGHDAAAYVLADGLRPDTSLAIPAPINSKLL